MSNLEATLHQPWKVTGPTFAPFPQQSSTWHYPRIYSKRNHQSITSFSKNRIAVSSYLIKAWGASQGRSQKQISKAVASKQSKNQIWQFLKRSLMKMVSTNSFTTVHGENHLLANQLPSSIPLLENPTSEFKVT